MKIAIAGAGISGLATAHAILSRQPTAAVTVFEAAPRVGGKVWSEPTPEGYLCEGGVNGFLDKVPRTLDLCAALELNTIAASAAAESRYVFSGQRLHRLPESPPEFLLSGLLSVPARLRVLCEALVPRGHVEDESLADFGTRRLGREAFEKLIDPMASGVFAGDPQCMSLKSCFPRIHEIESRYGSLIRGLVRLQVEARRAGRAQAPGPGPGGRLTSFAGGMSTLTDRLADRLGARVRSGCGVAAVEPAGRRWLLQLADGSTDEAERVVLAIPAHVQASLLHGVDAELGELVGAIGYPPVTVVCLGYEDPPQRQVPPGFGFLVPSREQRSILGTVVDSNVFSGRAPGSGVLLRTLVGGARAPGLADLPDATLLDRVRSDLESISGLTAEPDFVRIFRHERAIPQYRLGHAARLEAIESRLARHPGLVLTGNAFRGVSLNDCVVNAWKTAEALIPAAKGSNASGERGNAAA